MASTHSGALCKSESVTPVAVVWNCFLQSILNVTTLLVLLLSMVYAKDGNALNELPQPNDLPQIAKYLAFNMNRSVSPCENFYAYACGRYIESHTEQGKLDVGTRETQNLEEGRKLIEKLEELSKKSQHSSKAVLAAVTIYRKCREGGRQEVYEKFIREEGKRIVKELGGWPLTDSTWSGLPEGQTVFTLLGKIDRHHTASTLLQPKVTVDIEHVHRHSLSFLSPLLPFDYADDKTKQEITENFVKVIFPGKELPQLEKDIEEMLKMSKRLSQDISREYRERKQFKDQYNAFNLTSLQTTWQHIHWTEYLTTLVGNTKKEVEDLNVVIEHPETMDVVHNFLDECLKKGDRCMKSLVSYLVLSALRGWRNASRIDHRPQDAMVCAKDLVERLPVVTGRIYTGTGYSQEKRCAVRSLFVRLGCEFEKRLKKLLKLWLSPRTMLGAITKVKGISYNIAYSSWTMDDQKLDQVYADLTAKVTSETIAPENYLLTAAHNRKQELNKMFQKPDRHEIHGSPAGYGSWYDPFYNSVTVPATLMNPPLYDDSFPTAVNYGALGSILGREIAHALDRDGFNLTRNGTLDPWLSQHSSAEYLKIAKCVEDQYDEVCYIIRDKCMCVDGKRTERENIADIVGLQMAYRAYKTFAKTQGTEAPITGMADLSMEKIFFLAFAQSWCFAPSIDGLNYLLQNANYSPQEARVTEPLKNFPQFGKVFGCKTGDLMMPVKHCTVW